MLRHVVSRGHSLGFGARRFSEATASVLSCDIVLSSPSLRVLKLRSPGTGKSLTGLKVNFEQPDSGIEPGVVVLHRFPLVFVVGKFGNMTSTASAAIIGNCTIDPTGCEFSVNDLIVGSSDTAGGSGDGKCPLFQTVPDASEVQVLTHPLHTGISAIDVLTPIARGQNMLLVGVHGAAQDEVAETFLTTIRSSLTGQHADKVRHIFVSGHKNSSIDKLGAVNSGRLVQMYDSETSNGSHLAMNVVPSEFHLHMDLVERSARYLMLSHGACSVGDYHRKRGLHSVVMLDEDLYLLEVFWNFSSACLNRFVYGAGSADGSGFTNTNVADSGGNNSEKRRYYAFIFQQVGEQVDRMGGGSMSLFCRINRHLGCVDQGGAADAGEAMGSFDSQAQSFSVEDFEAAQCAKKVIERIRLLVDRGVAVTPAVLKKLEIPLPLPSTSTDGGGAGATAALIPELRFRRMIEEYAHEIKSHTDGHVIFDVPASERTAPGKAFNTTLHQPALVPNLSLSRVGGGTDKKVVQCGIPAIKNLTAQLRGELSQVNDVLPSDHSELVEGRRLRALSWVCALEQDVAAGPLRVVQQVALLSFVQRGYYDGFIRSVIQAHGVDTTADELQWVRLKELLFQHYDVGAFNRSLLAHEPTWSEDCLLERTGKMDEKSKDAIELWMTLAHDSLSTTYDQFRKGDVA